MESNKPSFNSIDEYIAIFPVAVQTKLKELRTAIKTAAPDALEKISYQMPAFSLKGNLVYFAAYKRHIGFYPTLSGINEFESELSGYQYSKGTIKFALEKPLPLDLISKIVKFRAAENLKKAEIKLSKKK
jgi:uncharacterized protein YdhG (YjbR/CyaY superfamily)